MGALARGLFAAERILQPGGVLAVVTFHSLEDRIVKKFMKLRSGGQARGSRHQPEDMAQAPETFTRATRKAIAPTEAELAGNPRARSAKLRMARRTDAPAGEVELDGLGLPRLDRMKEVRH